MTEDAKKKRKKRKVNSYTTFGNPAYDIATFNAITSGNGASETTYTPSAGSVDMSMGSDCCSGSFSGGESLDLNEDTLYSAKIDTYIELPNFIKLIPKTTIINAIEGIDPDEIFTVGYVTPLFFYKELKDKFTLIKCTELEGHTGYDYIESNIDDTATKQARLDNAKFQIKNVSNSSGKHADFNPAAGHVADFSTDYELVNKTVAQHKGRKVDLGAGDENLSSILFYPTIGQTPKVDYFIAVGDATQEKDLQWYRITEDRLMALVEKIVAEMEAANAKSKRWDIQKLKAKVHNEIETSSKTISSVAIDSGDSYETRSKFNKGGVDGEVINKDPVRALYTNQIYYFSSDKTLVGKSLLESIKDYQRQSDKLVEKRETKRYYIRPQNIFCANKADVLKGLIDVANAGENCTVYSLKTLDDHDDVGKLTNDDIIYYYDDNVLYDKNHELVMDYDLFIKHEEERKKFADIDAVSKAEYIDAYSDRMTKETVVETLTEDLSLSGIELALDKGEILDLGEITTGDLYQNFDSDEAYSHTAVTLYKDKNLDKYIVCKTDYSNLNNAGDIDEEQFDTFDEVLNYLSGLELINCKFKELQNTNQNTITILDQEFESFDLNKKFKKIYEDWDEALREEQEDVCVICGEPYGKYGNNPWPVKDHGQCCAACNRKFVLPARLANLDSDEDELDQEEE